MKNPPFAAKKTNILFPDQAKSLVQSLRKHSKKELASKLQISEKLADLNYARYQNWLKTDTKSALWLYSGDVYNGLDAFSMSKSDVDFAQDNLLIVSGLYGLVRPLDAIRPYRLEMKLSYEGDWGKSLYQAWGKNIIDYIEKTEQDTILMCASNEYAKAVTDKLPSHVRVITPRFMQENESGLKEKGLFAKYSRGALARYAINNRVTNIVDLQAYNGDGFKYSSKHSTPESYVYIIPKNFSLKGRFTKD